MLFSLHYIFLNPFSVSCLVISIFPDLSKFYTSVFFDSSKSRLDMGRCLSPMPPEKIRSIREKIEIREKIATAGFEPRTLAVVGWRPRPLDHHGPLARLLFSFIFYLLNSVVAYYWVRLVLMTNRALKVVIKNYIVWIINLFVVLFYGLT